MYPKISSRLPASSKRRAPFSNPLPGPRNRRDEFGAAAPSGTIPTYPRYIENKPVIAGLAQKPGPAEVRHRTACWRARLSKCLEISDPVPSRDRKGAVVTNFVQGRSKKTMPRAQVYAANQTCADIS